MRSTLLQDIHSCGVLWNSGLHRVRAVIWKLTISETRATGFDEDIVFVLIYAKYEPKYWVLFDEAEAGSANFDQ